jgi:WhiB family transcriptional regulator, redox-sensing transcriptional regulator
MEELDANVRVGGMNVDSPINLSLNIECRVYFRLSPGCRSPAPKHGSFPMPDDTTIADAAQLLSPQLLQDARSDTGRGWAARALCVGADPEDSFPSGYDPAIEARAICAACPARGQCLAYAITADERFGIWGGLDPRQRRTLRRRLNR